MRRSSSQATKKRALQTPSIQSLDRGLFILETVAKAPDPVALGQLTDLLGIDRSSVFRLANTLKRRGFLANPSGRKDYILGPSIWRISRNHDWSKMLITYSHDHVKALATRTGETTHLAVREGKWKLLVNAGLSGADGSHVELYDLSTDGNETSNVADANPELAKWLKAAALGWKRSLPAKGG